MLVREADESDVEHLARLRASWRGQPLSADFITEFRAWFGQEQATRWWWLAVDADDPIGMVNVKLFGRMPSPGRPPSRWGYVANLYVEPGRRGTGVGGSLVTAAIDRARQEGLVRLVLSPSEQSIPLYRRHGFRPAHELLLLPLEPETGRRTAPASRGHQPRPRH